MNRHSEEEKAPTWESQPYLNASFAMTVYRKIPEVLPGDRFMCYSNASAEKSCYKDQPYI